MEEAHAHGDLEATDQNLHQNFPSTDPRWDLNLPDLEVAEMGILWCKACYTEHELVRTV